MAADLRQDVMQPGLGRLHEECLYHARPAAEECIRDAV
jgi:hypothetical protein